jgi:F0F1-type ATP synthase membrane subunit c/vacuolar-type H+-ATPase subunit K
MHLASGLSVGLAGIAAGYTIGIVGDAVRLTWAGSSIAF